MSMREECRHFQSRTYRSGEVARFCVLGNAPDQPWSCPSDCPTYERRLADAGWAHGTLVDRPVESMPEGGDETQRRELLASADEIVNAVASEFIEERRRAVGEIDAPRRWKFWRR